MTGKDLPPGELTAGIDERLSHAHPDRLRSYRAHIALRQVDWSIRHHDAGAVEHWLDVTDRLIDD
jgi:hypothetical protein